MDRKAKIRAVRNLVVELLVYAIMVTVYALGVLQFLTDPLAELYNENPTLYAWASLGMIVGQGVLLEEVTSFLVDRLRLVRFE